ncbi:MAG: MFS transporter [Burkholderiaceae bacterium]|nr:MFS transporter [Burkholderiaceae bacterium]
MKKNGNSGFYRLLSSEAFSTVASTCFTVAIPIIAVSALSVDIFTLSILAATGQMAPLLFGLSAGAIADKVNRRRILVAAHAVRAALMAALAIAVWIEVLNVALLALSAFALSCAQLLCDSAMASAVPAVVRRSKLTWANGWLQGVASAGQSVAPVLAGVMVQMGSIGLLFTLGVIAHLLSAVFINTIPSNLGTCTGDDTSPHFQQIKQGLSALWRDPVQRAIAVSSASFNFFHSAFFTLFPFYALNTINLSPTTLGLILSAVGIAGLIAAVFAERLINRIGVPISLIGSLFVVLPFSLLITFGADITFPFNAVLIVLAFAAWDFAVVLNLVIEHSIRQAMVPPEFLSRVAASQRFVAWGVDPLGALAGGTLAATALGVSTTLNLAMGAWVHQA